MSSVKAFRLIVLIILISVTLTLLHLFFPHNLQVLSNHALSPQSNATQLPPIIKHLESPLETYPEFAIALKTGADVVAERCAIQTTTFLSKVKNLILIAESSEISLGDTPIYNVYTDTLPTPHNTSLRNIAHPLKKRAKDALEIDQSSMGWKLDAHKNIPGMRLLYEKFPHAEWYIMIDDDTYMFFSNLRSRIESLHLDPAKPHYLGSSNVFTGCDGVTSFDDSPTFAHGGSGIVVSNGAMKKMLKVVDSCIERYRDCWGGDIRLALCLRDATVFLNAQEDFNGEPPNMDFPFHNVEPCMRPVTFHHLLPQQIQLLYETEKKMQGDVTYANVVDRFKLLNYNTINKLDRPGYHYTVISTTDVVECRSHCEMDARCISWSLVDGQCRLKDTHRSYAHVDDKNTFSNVYPIHYTCADRE